VKNRAERPRIARLGIRRSVLDSVLTKLQQRTRRFLTRSGELMYFALPPCIVSYLNTEPPNAKAHKTTVRESLFRKSKAEPLSY